jgi:IclR family pca regulon transcriptional regulator
MTTSPLEAVPSRREEFLESLANGLALLRLFDRETPALTIQSAALRLKITRAAARRILLTLQRLEYLASDGREFRPTPLVLQLGFSYLTALALPELVKPILQRVTFETGESCSLGVLHGPDVVLVAYIEPPRQALRVDIGIGSRLPAYLYSMGRVLLARLDKAALDAVLAASDLRRYTPKTMTEPKELRRAVAAVGRDGFCVSEDEMFFGVGSIAVPAGALRGEPVALACAMFHGGDRDAMRARYLPILRDAASEIAALLAARIGENG